MEEESVYSGHSFHGRPGCDGYHDIQKSVTIQTPANQPLLDNEETGREEEEEERDDNWGETTTAVTSERSVSLEDVSLRKGPSEAEPGRPDPRMRIGFYAFCVLGALTLLTPPVFITLPQVLWYSELEACGVICEGLYISVAFKMLFMVLGSWALFLRTPRYVLPRLVEFRALLLLLLGIFLLSYWLFYVVRVLGGRERNLLSVVQYAASMVDAFIFIHYLAVVLLELRQLQPYYILQVTRSSDGVTRFYTLGTISIQRAALFVLENYYKDFPAYTPEPQGRKQAKPSRKSARVDGNTTSQSQLNSSLYKDRYYEDIEYDRKIRRRRARLVVAVHNAFSQVSPPDDGGKSSQVLPPREAAQSVFPLIAQSLQRYLRSTQQAHLYSMEAIVQHLTQCLTHSISAQAFLEQYLKPGPLCQYSGAQHDEWTLVCEEAVTGSLHSGLTFLVCRTDTRLVVSLSAIPRLTLRESFIPPNSHRFVVRLYPQVLDTISPA
ncbi:vang-like protein 1 [Hyperolius riggenbachi]|uniref:vang-like protein 1 n=1 Tax=Hyperolius riggenbachi TaxID=752182 RepID=UPI0035A33625